MRKNKINLLKSLIEIPSPSGFEEDIANFIHKELLKYLPRTKVNIDNQNNVIAIIEGTTNKKIMIDAHLDEIGFIVSNVDRWGLISLQYIGGGDYQILTARHLNILTDKGRINAVIDRKHSHLIKEEDEEKIDRIYQAQIDIGVRGRKAVLSKVKIGNPVVYKPHFFELAEDKKKSGKYITGYGFDDKSGCFILIETIKEIIKTRKKPKSTLIFTFSSQEETGKTKVKSLVKKYKPSLFIETDVTFATDYGDEELEKEVGRCELGKGIVLYRGVDIDRNALKLMNSVARNNKIKIQYQASVGNIGYTSNEVTDYCPKALIIGIPLRNMHTPTEIINTKDLNYGINLLKNFLLSRNLKKIL
jgi:endoglucanase